jgi:hypothetical protein
MIIDRIGDIETEKTNIFPTEYMPTPAERWTYSDQFVIEKNVLYVALGKISSDHLTDICNNLLSIHHPGYPLRKGRAAIRNYIKKAVEEIKKLITAEKLRELDRLHELNTTFNSGDMEGFNEALIF